ncbi:MAG: Fic family protein [Parabacteroides sp.]|nr:Fic family protein [Parabacteroides sp.]
MQRKNISRTFAQQNSFALSPDAVRDTMPLLTELMASEENALVRAILSHFFFVYIHPYMDGNGRTARFLMNVLFVTSHYPWRIITVDERASYMAAQEKASIEGDITVFAKLIMERNDGDR